MCPKGIENSAFDSLVTCDHDEECYGELDDEAICAEVIKSSSNEPLVLPDEDDADAGQDTTTTKPTSYSEVSAALATLRKFLDETSSDTTTFYELEDQVTHLVFQRTVQSKITDYFSP